MPELPEVETVVAAIAPHLKGAVVDSVSIGRKPMRFNAMRMHRPADYVCRRSKMESLIN